jgi:hypothetical protein
MPKQQSHLTEQHHRDLAVLEASQAAFTGIPDAILQDEIARALAEVRRRNRGTAGLPIT